MNKNIRTCFVFLPMLLLSAQGYSQLVFPNFLQGTWKMQNKDVYEHWDLLSAESMKGISYKIKDNQIIVSEYLDLARQGKDIVYTATVINQNNGKGIDFELVQSDSLFVFENPMHDFPKKIVYRKQNEHQIWVEVSDGKQKGFSYIMNKQKEIPN